MSASDSELEASETLRRQQEECRRYEGAERIPQEDRYRYIEREPFTKFILQCISDWLDRDQYPPKLHCNDKFYPGWRSASALVQKALEGRLDPNTHWTYEDIIAAEPLTPFSDYAYTWSRWNTPLHLALLCFDYESIRVILRHGGDPYIHNGAGRTPIHEAIKLQNPEAIRFLIRHGADPNIALQNDLVPLHAALYEGDEETFFTLHEEGATWEAAAYCEWSIADLALLASEKSILERLMSDEYGQLPTPLMQSPGASSRPTPQNIATSAQRLLAVVSSNQVLPEKDLYETYQYVFSVLNIPQHQRWDAATVNDLVNNTMESLYGVSQRPRLALDERFCSECLKFQALIENYPMDRAAAKWEAYLKPVDIHKNKRELDTCALSGCPICLAMSNGLKELKLNDRGGNGADDEVSPVRMRLWTQGKIDYGNGESLDRRRIKSFSAQIGNSKYLCGSFGLHTYDTGFEIHQKDSVVHDTSTGSQKAFSVAKQWLQICKTSPKHSICRDTYGPSGSCSTLPTRVLHVGSENEEPFLFESNGLRQRYCILSYCWGISGNAITTKSNLSDRTKAIPLASLPTLLRQAVTATRSLGYEYLWIDALCIIQDDPDDWAREAATMHDLYSRADLTITSLVAADCGDNLFESRSRETARPIPLHISLPKRYRHPPVDESVFEFAAYPSRNRLETSGMEGPVNQRAWTLQEQLMSTRVLYFGHGILHWECLCSYQLEGDPEGMSLGGIPFDHQGWKARDARRRTKLTVKTPQERGSQQKKASPFKVWQSLVEEFTRRKLTKRSDRIPAFLAISKVLCKAGGDEFCGGLWTGKQLIPSVCWKLEQADETDMRGPSWTWGSRSGEISYKLLQHRGKMKPKASPILVDTSTDRSHSNISGSITLKGFLGACRSDSKCRDTGRTVIGWGISKWFDHTSESRDNLYIFDMVESGRTPPHPPSLGVQPLYMSPEKHIVSLLLKSVDVGKDFRTASVFRRVGIAKKSALERYGVSDEAGYDETAQDRDVIEFETDRVVVII